MQIGRCCKCSYPHVFNRYMRVVGPIDGGERTTDTTAWDEVTVSPSGTTTFSMPTAAYGTTTSMVPMRYTLSAGVSRNIHFEQGAVLTSSVSHPYLLDIGARDTLIPLGSHWLSEAEITSIEFRPYIYGTSFIWDSFHIGPPNAVTETACVVTGYRIWVNDEDVTGIVDTYARITEAIPSQYALRAALVEHIFTTGIAITNESTIVIDIWYERDFNTRYINSEMLARCIDFGYSSFDDYIRNYQYSYVDEIGSPYLFRYASERPYTESVVGTPPTTPSFYMRYHTAITCRTRYPKPIKNAAWIVELEAGYSVTLGGLTTINVSTESGWTWTESDGLILGKITGGSGQDVLRIQYRSEVPEIAIRWAAAGDNILSLGKWAIYVPEDSSDYTDLTPYFAGRGVWSDPRGSSTFVLRGRVQTVNSTLQPDAYGQYPPTITLTRV